MTKSHGPAYHKITEIGSDTLKKALQNADEYATTSLPLYVFEDSGKYKTSTERIKEMDLASQAKVIGKGVYMLV